MISHTKQIENVERLWLCVCRLAHAYEKWEGLIFHTCFIFVCTVCSMLRCIWCLGAPFTGCPTLVVLWPTSNWHCMFPCGSELFNTQHRFVPLSIHCQYAFSYLAHSFTVQLLPEKYTFYDPFECRNVLKCYCTTLLAASVLLYGIGRITWCGRCSQRGEQGTFLDLCNAITLSYM